jgi:hypothetical protein
VRRTFCNEFYFKCSQIEQQATIINPFHNEPANSSKLFTFKYLFCCQNDKCDVEWRGKVWGTYAYARFKNIFRVSRTTFVYILNRIKHQLERKTIAEDPIEPDLLLGLRLYRLGIGAYYYTIVEMVGLGVFTGVFYCSRSVVNSYRTIVADAISRHKPQPREEVAKKIMDMEEFWQFPCCWAAVDSCHIPTKCPSGGLHASKEYHNFKKFYSVVLMT